MKLVLKALGYTAVSICFLAVAFLAIFPLPVFGNDVRTWSPEAGTNNLAAPNGFPENMAPSGVNDAAREVMAAVRRLYANDRPFIETTGSANAYALAATGTISSYITGDVYGFIASFANTGTASLNVDSVGAKEIVKPDGFGLSANDIAVGQHVLVSYSATGDNFQVLGGVSSLSTPVAIGDGGTGSTTAADARVALAVASTGANTFTADQILLSTDAGAGQGPLVTLNRDSASPATNDTIGGILWQGDDTGGNALNYTTVRVAITDPSDGNEDGQLLIITQEGGVEATRMFVDAGVVVGSATGGDQGAGTINATGVYDDGVLVTNSWVLLETQAIAAAATPEFTANIDSTYEAYVLVLTGVEFDTNQTELWMQFGTGGGPTWQTTSYDTGGEARTPTEFDLGANNGQEFQLTPGANTGDGVGNAAGESLRATIWIYDPANTGIYTGFDADIAYVADSGTAARASAAGHWETTTAVTAVRVYAEEGNIDGGRVTLYGVRYQ